MFYVKGQNKFESEILEMVKEGKLKGKDVIHPCNPDGSHASNKWIKVSEIEIIIAWVQAAPPETQWCKDCQEWQSVEPFELRQKWGYVSGVKCPNGHTIRSGIGGWWVSEQKAKQNAADAVRSDREHDTGHHHFSP